MIKLSRRQKQLLAEFLSNFALAWITFGLIAPLFTAIENISFFVVRLMVSLTAAFLSLKFALDYTK